MRSAPSSSSSTYIHGAMLQVNGRVQEPGQREAVKGGGLHHILQELLQRCTTVLQRDRGEYGSDALLGWECRHFLCRRGFIAQLQEWWWWW